MTNVDYEEPPPYRKKPDHADAVALLQTAVANPSGWSIRAVVLSLLGGSIGGSVAPLIT